MKNLLGYLLLSATMFGLGFIFNEPETSAKISDMAVSVGILPSPTPTIKVVPTPEVLFTWPTGYEVWNAVNEYRKNMGKEPMILDDRLCNNIAERWQNYKDKGTHDGLREFHDRYMSSFVEIMEDALFMPGSNAKQMVEAWASSPGHNMAILKAKRGCSYSHQYYSILLMSPDK